MISLLPIRRLAGTAMLGLALTVAGLQITQASQTQPVMAAAAHSAGSGLPGYWFAVQANEPIRTLTITAQAFGNNFDPPYRVIYTVHVVATSRDVVLQTAPVPFFSTAPISVTFGPPCRPAGQLCIFPPAATFTTLTMSRSGASLHVEVSSRNVFGTFTSSEDMATLSL